MPFAHRFRSIAAPTLLTIVLFGNLWAQDQAKSRLLRGPVIGFVYEGASGIRPILGIPGAATVGAPVIAQGAFERVAVAPGRDFALAVLADGLRVAIVKDLTDEPSAAVLDLAAGPDRIEFSPSGDAAALFYSASAQVEVLTGLPSAPSVAWSFELSEVSSGLAALAISDGGGAILVAGAGEPAPVWVVAPDAGQRFLYAASASPRITFLFASEDAAIADTSTGDVVLVRDPKREPHFTRIGGRAEGISRPVAVAVTRDNRRLIVASAEPAAVVSLGLLGDSPMRLTCPCQPTALTEMASGSVFLLNELGKGPLWLLDSANPVPRIVFVPYQTQLLRETGRAPLPRRAGGDR